MSLLHTDEALEAGITIEDAEWLKSFDASEPKISQEFIAEVTEKLKERA